MRIVSLLPAATETLSALGLGGSLVGRSHECDHPPGVEELPVCSLPRYDPAGPSPEIDREVTAVLREALSIYRVDVDRIRALAPTHIVTQSQCRVCAVSTDEIRRALREVVSVDDISLVDLNPETLEGVLGTVTELGVAMGVPDAGRKLEGEMRTAFDALSERSSRASRHPTVAQIEWIEPLMTGGHWMLELVRIAGGTNVFPAGRGPRITFDDLVRTDPEVIVVAPCGFSIQRSLENMSYLAERPGWGSLQAVRNRRVFISDGSRYFSRPGPRLVDSAEILAEVYHPDMYPPRHRGSGWIRFD